METDAPPNNPGTAHQDIRIGTLFFDRGAQGPADPSRPYQQEADVFTHWPPRVTLQHGPVILTALVLLLGACAPTPVAQSEPPAPTLPPQAATETLPPATQVPTAAPTETAIPKPKLGPEELALSIEQVTGKWAMRFMGGGGGDAGVFTLAEDGTFRMDGVSGDHAGMNLGYGTFRFEGDVLLLESDACLTDEFFVCTASYNVFVSMAEGMPAKLRFIAIDDPFVDRKKSLDEKTFIPYREQ